MEIIAISLTSDKENQSLNIITCFLRFVCIFSLASMRMMEMDFR